jgi:hypothetical protein
MRKGQAPYLRDRTVPLGVAGARTNDREHFTDQGAPAAIFLTLFPVDVVIQIEGALSSDALESWTSSERNRRKNRDSRI